MTRIAQTALMIATVAHKAIGQKRKYSGEDYIIHPVAVAKIVTQYTPCEYTEAAALLHDVVEDTEITEQDLLALLMEVHSAHEARTVVDIVMGVTKVSVPEDGVRKVRRYKDHLHFANGDWRVQLVKAADMLHNCRHISVADKGFAKRYIPEKQESASMLTLAPKDLLDQLTAILTYEAHQLEE